jgi:predicted N-acetyltransferase YhbS
MLAPSGSSTLGTLPHQISTIRVRRGTPDDYASVAQLSQAVYGVNRSLDSIRWLYDENPAGTCAFWLAAEADEVVALRPVFPWRVQVGGREVLAAQAGDAMTHPAYRGRGLFTSLVEGAWADLEARQIPFCFSFSNPGSLSVYRKIVVGTGPRAGSHVVLQFRRMVYPLSLELVRSRFTVPRAIVSNLDVLYRTSCRWLWTPSRHFSIFPVTRFDAEFDALWARTADRYGVLTARDSRYLNWRFIDSPSGRYQVIGLRTRGTLAGYVACETDGHGSGSIADLFSAPEPDLINGLLAGALSGMLKAGCVRVSLWTPEQSPLFAVIRKFGFVPRGDSFPMAVHVYHDGPEAGTALDGRRWLAWFGDRDVEAATPTPAGLPERPPMGDHSHEAH